MLQAAVSARAERFGETAMKALNLRVIVRQQQTEIANLKHALSAEQRTSAFWRERWRSEVEANVKCASLDSIVNATCEFYGVSKMSVLSPRRKKEIAHARQVAMYVARETTRRSLPVIGRHFHKDHTTVQYACCKIADMMRRDMGLAAAIRSIAAKAIAADFPVTSEEGRETHHRRTQVDARKVFAASAPVGNEDAR